jgi:transposase
VVVPDASPVEQLAAENASLRAAVGGLRAENARLWVENAKLGELKDVVAVLSERVTELERERAVDSSNSSRLPSSDAPWVKKPAKKRSSRTRSGRKPGKQPGASSSSRSLIDDPDEQLVIRPDRCRRCDASLAEAEEHSRQRRQVVDVCPPPPPKVTEYQRVSKRCGCCGVVTTPGWDDPAVPAEHAQTVAAPGSPVRIVWGSKTRCSVLTCDLLLLAGRG